MPPGVTAEVGKRGALLQAQRLQPLGFAYFRSHTPALVAGLAEHAGPSVELMAMADTVEWSEFWALMAL